MVRFIGTGVSVLAASRVIPGVTIDSVAAGVAGVLALALLNAVVRPLLYVLSVPFIVVTFGLFMIAINAFLLFVVSVFVDGFHVEGFWPAAGGALLISLVSGGVNLVLSNRGRVEIAAARVRPRRVRHIN